MATRKTKGTTPIAPTTRKGSYTAQDSVSYVGLTNKMASASAKMRFSKDTNAQRAGQIEFAKTQAELKSNPYSKSKSTKKK